MFITKLLTFIITSLLLLAKDLDKS